MTSTKFVDDVINAFAKGETGEVTKLLEKEIKKSRSAGRIVVAKRLNNLLKIIPVKTLSGQTMRSNAIVSDQEELLFEKIYSNISIEEIVLDTKPRQIISSFLREWEAIDNLTAQNVFPINKLIFYGPPGTGKTKLAYGIANKLELPLVIVKLDELISSYLGKTGKNIREIFDIAKREKTVIFLDEIDTIAKHRDDTRELGELKRVVTVLLQNIDSFPFSSILIGATNHENLLDNALWRRFGIKLHIDLPSRESRSILFNIFLAGFSGTESIDYELLAGITDGVSGSFIYDVAQSIKRSAIIESKKKIDTPYCLKHTISLAGSFSGTEKINKKSLYSISQKLKSSGYSLKEIESISGIPYTTLRDNIA